jgi:undecaprenyl-diphosphatase
MKRPKLRSAYRAPALRAIVFGIAMILAAAGAFADIAEDVADHESSGLDRSVSLALHGFDSPFMDVAMRILSALGSASVVVFTVAAIALWALRRGERRAAAILVALGIVTEALNLALKLTFQRTRPSLFVEIVTLHSYSFPSGHSMSAAAVYGMCAIVAARLRPSAARSLAIATPVLALLIGVSRVFLGVHWPTDVLAGFCAGAILLLMGVFSLGGRPSDPRTAQFPARD